MLHTVNTIFGITNNSLKKQNRSYPKPNSLPLYPRGDSDEDVEALYGNRKVFQWKEKLHPQWYLKQVT